MIIKSKEKYDSISNLINKIFYSENRLPEQVFHENFTNFLVNEFNYILTSDFWEAIQSSSLINSTKNVYVVVLDPDPIKYFYPEFGYYNAFEFPLTLSPDDYWQALEQVPQESPADAILYNSSSIAVFPDSMNWAIWGDRDLEISIIGFNRENRADRIPFSLEWWPKNNNWMTIEKVINALLPPIFSNQGGKVPKTIAEPLQNNYGSS